VGWDPERYRLEVLEPSRRAGNIPPVDLYARYGLTEGLSSEKAFDARIAEVVAYWRTLKTRRTYARLADALLANHAELDRAGGLTLKKFGELQADSHRGQTELLARLAESEAGTATVAGPLTVTRLRDALKSSVSEAEVRAALSKAGVRVVDSFPELPAVPHPKAGDLIQLVQQLGLRLSPEAVFGDAMSAGFRVLPGFRLTDGRQLSEASIGEARRRVDALPHSDPAKTVTENILAILRGAARNAAELNTLLLSEIVGRLRHFADSGFQQRAIATQARDLGLGEDEAGIIAAAILARDTVGTVRLQVEEELARGQLRSAQRLAASLPADDPLRQAVAARDAEVTALARRADEELAVAGHERAARLLAEAMALATDDIQLSERLAALPPPPAQGAVARVSGEHVLITWTASPTAAGQPHYRVMRGEGRAPAAAGEGTAVVTQTERQDVTDTEAPPGAALFYSVFATRGGSTWSAPAATQSVVFTPEVAGLSVETGETSVALSWRVHPGTESVIAVRAEGRPPQGPQDGTVVDASLAGLTDTGLRTGAEYFYRIAASYRTSAGQRRSSAGVVVPAVPMPAPDAVTRLEVRTPAGGGTGLVAAWAPPRYGQVRLVLADKPPRWPVGTSLTADEMGGLRQLPGIPRRGPDGLDVLELSVPPGRHYLVALTAGGRSVVVGDWAEVGLAEPFRDLSALRMRDVVRLSWIWPDDATDAAVRWPGGSHSCSRRVYEDEGGVTVSVGPAETVIEVFAVYSHPAGELTAPAARVTVSGRGISLNYRIHRTSRMHPRQRTIEIAAEQPLTLPALVVVRAVGPYAPDDPAEGETLTRIEPQPITPEQPVRVVVELPKGRAWLACFVDPDAAQNGAPGVLLFPPATEEMKIR
jgi:hypothetical protein